MTFIKTIPEDQAEKHWFKIYIKPPRRTWAMCQTTSKP